MRPLTRLLLLVVIAGLFGAGCRSFSIIDETFELLAAGGRDQLRHELRPIRGGTRVLLIGVDGLSDATLKRAIAEGQMPNLARLLGHTPLDDHTWSHGYAVPDVTSILPSETAAGWAATLTGHPPAENSISGNEWYDRRTGKLHFPVPISMDSYKENLEIYSDRYFSEHLQVYTLFEKADVRSHVSMAFVYRGADFMTRPDLNDIGDVLEIITSRIISGGDTKEPYRELDSDTWEGANATIRDFGVPDLQVAYFPGADLITHKFGSEAQWSYLRNETDANIGRLIDLYEREGVLDSTYIILTSDHGHTDTLDDDAHSFIGAHEPDEPPALFDSLGIRLRPFERSTSDTTFQAVMTYDEAVAYVYLADRSTCAEENARCDWSTSPRLEEDVLPVARAFHDANQTGAHVPAMQGALDLILVRSSVLGASVPFQVFDGEQLLSIADYLAQNPRPDLFRLEERLGWLTDGPYGYQAGDILLMAKSGDEIPIEERFYFGSPHRSGHGGAHRSDSHIPLLVAHAARTGEQIAADVEGALGDAPSQLDVTPLVLHLLGRRSASLP
ncbi:MAG: hypothetical protein RhofKO_19750 [Rhodothermales bacterium]